MVFKKFNRRKLVIIMLWAFLQNIIVNRLILMAKILKSPAPYKHNLT